MSQAEKLVADLIQNLHDVENTKHVGRINRLYSTRSKILAALDAEREADATLYRLLSHADEKARDFAARRYLFRGEHVEESLAVMQALSKRSDQLGRETRSFLEERPFERKLEPSVPRERPKFPFQAMPAGIDRAAAEAMILEAGFGETLCKLLRPAVRLWPRPDPLDATASRLGGLPAIPANFVRPVWDDEPFWFLGQINCAELGPRAERFGLPPSGLLSFFGDHDDVNGCTPAGGGEVFYFTDLRELSVARPPFEDFEPQISCGLSFFDTFELPHAYEAAFERCNFSDAQTSTYIDLRLKIASLGKPELWPGQTEISKLMSGYEISKLFGWPDRIQIDDIEAAAHGGPRLLLQLGEYTNGEELHDWGPGGLVYFTLAPRDLKARRFDRAELTVQAS